jgi:hypothetical protein
MSVEDRVLKLEGFAAEDALQRLTVKVDRIAGGK